MMLEALDRKRLSGLLRSERADMARRITAEFLERHPGWVERYGDAAIRFGEEDVGYHLDFLAGALLSREPAPFEGYATWAAQVLASRGVARRDVIENLEQIRQEVGRTLSPRDREWVDHFVGAGIDAIRSGADGDGDATPTRTTPLVARYLEAVLGSDRRAALAVAVEALEAGKSVPELYQDLLTPAQYEIGRRWAATDISVAQEHVATSITQYVVAQLYPHLEVPEPSRGRAVVTGVDGELHQIGAHMVADFLETDGWDVRFLGSHLPTAEILDAIERHEARLLAVSVTILANVPTAGALLEEARARFPDLRILLGGRPFTSGSWEDLGADGIGFGLEHAVELARTVTGDGTETIL